MNRQNIEVISDHDDFVMFKTSCMCSLDDHNLTVIVEKTSTNEIMASIYFNVGWRDKSTDNIFRKILGRIKTAFSILFKGYISINDEFMFRDSDHLKDFRKTFEEAIAQIERDTKHTI